MTEKGIEGSISGESRLPLVTAIFVTSLIISNIIAVKMVSVGFVSFPAALVIFPISYIFGDVLTEVYGYARARRVIWMGFACNVLAVFAIWISILLPPAPFWNMGDGTLSNATNSQQAYRAVFGLTPRILASSFLAYLVGEFLNSYVLARMKIFTRGRHLWTRTIGSTLVGQLADSLIFITFAFFGTIPSYALVQIIITQWLLKSVYESVATPFTYAVVNHLKRVENEDFYDYGTNFNPLLWRD